MLALRGGELVVAAFFYPHLPPWKPATWLALTWLANIGVYVVRRSQRFRAAPDATRLRVMHGFSWFDLCSAASAGYFLHVPDKLAMQLLLQACLNVVATFWILERPRNSRLGGLGAFFIAMPASLVVLAEAQGVGWFPWLLAVGQVCFCALLWFFAIKTETNINLQIELRHHAETARAQLAEATAAKVQFFAAASHDLRQPVHAIGLYLAALQQGQSVAGADRAIQGIRQSWMVLDELLVKILDLARINNQAIKPSLMAMSAHVMARDVIETLFSVAQKKSIRLVLLGRHGTLVMADPFMLRRVLSNLIDNAIKFSPEGSTVAVILRTKRGIPVVEVRDAGPGIAPENHARIYHEFVQLGNFERNRNEGFGLGLAVVNAFAQAMHGRLELASALGKGSTFRLLLPAAQQAGDSPVVETATAGTLGLSTVIDASRCASLAHWLRQRGQRILLVEDDDLVADAFARFMRRMSLPFAVAPNAARALALPREELAFAVCDLRLPGSMQGMELAQTFQASGMGVVIVSGEDAPASPNVTGPTPLIFMRKPVQPQMLLDAFAQMIPQAEPVGCQH